MSEIPELIDFNFTLTDEVRKRKWSDVYAKRNRLLLMSDWTQLLDSNLSQGERHIWMDWRKKIRNVNNKTFENSEDALNILISLENQIPDKINSDIDIQFKLDKEIEIDNIINSKIQTLLQNDVLPKIINIEDIINIVKSQLTENNTALISNLNNYVDNKLLNPIALNENIDEAKLQVKDIIDNQIEKKLPKLNSDLFEDVLEYAVNKKVNKLLKIYSEKLNLNIEETVKYFLDIKRDSYNTTCKLEEYRFDLLKKLEMCNTKNDLFNLISEMHKWI